MKKILFAFCIAFVFLPVANAAEAVKPVYAVLSLIGDRLEIVVAQARTGSNLDTNRRDFLAINNAAFDDAVVSATAEAVRKIKPGAELTALNTRSAVLFEKHRELFAQSGDTIAMPDAIRAALKNQNATHLFLITKHRDDARVQFAGGTIDGKGRLEGIGFYLDGTMDTSVSSTGAAGRGLIAPFAYFNVALIDLATNTVMKKQRVVSSAPYSSGRAEKDIGSPWAALSSAEKVQILDKVIRDEVARVVPLLMQ